MSIDFSILSFNIKIDFNIIIKNTNNLYEDEQ